MPVKSKRTKKTATKHAKKNRVVNSRAPKKKAKPAKTKTKKRVESGSKKIIASKKKVEIIQQTKKVKRPMKVQTIKFEPEGIAPYQTKASEDYMSPMMSDHFRKILLVWRNRLMTEANRTVDQMRVGSVVLADLNDRATQEEEVNLELRARDRDRKLIKKIESSLHAIDEGEYGYCEACGEEIGLRRLEARPTARLCIDCKELDEIREKQIGS